MIHHIIPKHEWKQRFGSLHGVNATDNLVNLTTEQHVQAHRFLYELNGSEFDKIAFLTLSGAVGGEDAHRLAVSFANKGRVHTPEARKNMSKSKLGKPLSEQQKQRISSAKIGKPKSQQTRLKMSEAAKGKVFSQEHKTRMSLARLGKKRGSYNKTPKT